MVRAGQGILINVTYKQDLRHRVLLIASLGKFLLSMLVCSAKYDTDSCERKIKLLMSVPNSGLYLGLCGLRSCVSS